MDVEYIPKLEVLKTKLPFYMQGSDTYKGPFDSSKNSQRIGETIYMK